MTTTSTYADTTTIQRPPQLVLPGPGPYDWDGGPRSALVLAAHPGDAIAGFGLGIDRMQRSGWTVRILTLFGGDPAAHAEVDAAISLLDAGRLTRRHHAARSDAERQAALAAAQAEAVAHDLVVAPVRTDASADHRAVADAVCPASVGGPVLRYLLPGQDAGAGAAGNLRRITAVRRQVAPLASARARLLAAMTCLHGAAVPDGAGLATITELVLI